MEDSIKIILIFPKTSEEYQLEKTNLLNAKNLEKSTSDILYKFEEIYSIEKNPAEAPLNESDLKRLPNLFEVSIDSSEYNKFLDVLFEFSRSRSLKQPILNYLNSYLEKLDLKSNLNNHSMISVLYMLFFFYYGENGCNLKEKSGLSNEESRMQIKLIGAYLGEAPNSPTSKLARPKIYANLKLPCRILQQLLHLKIAESAANLARFKARDLCKRLFIELELAFLIRLSLNDMRRTSCKGEGENLVLVIGYTGAGKSTTINYLYGVEYMGNISFCDLPGFNDTGLEPYKSFASLGLPLAVHTAKDRSIQAVLAVIEYDAFKMRLEQIAVVMKTIHSILETCNNGNQLPILYLITRPDLPPPKHLVEDEDEYRRLCDVDETVKTLMGDIRNLIKKEKTSLVEPNAAVKQNLNQKLKKLVDCQVVLNNLELFRPQQPNYWQNITKRLYRNDIIDRGNLAIEKENFIRELKKLEDIENESIEMMSQFIEDVLSELGKENPLITNMVDNKRKQLESEIDKTVNEIVKNDETEVKFKEQTNLIEFISKIGIQDIMIIRGFTLKDDNHAKWQDHKQRLFDRLNQICSDKQRPLSSLKINGEDAQFRGVKAWLSGKLNYFVESMQALIERENQIEKLRDQRNTIMRQIEIDRKLLISTISRSMNEKDNAELIERIEDSIGGLKRIKEKHENKYCSENESLLNSCLKEIDDIRNLKPIEYGSRLCTSTQNIVSRLLRMQSEYTYTFPRVYSESPSGIFEFIKGKSSSNEHVLPIAYAELSCVSTKKNKLVVRTPLDVDFQMVCDRELAEKCTFVENVTYTENIKDVNTINKDQAGGEVLNVNGKFTTVKANLSDGYLKVGYVSDPGKNSMAAIRCFVKAEHFPSYVKKIKEYNIKIEECKKNKSIFENIIRQLNKEIASKEEFLNNTVKGLYDKKKGEVILDILGKFDYDLENFLNVMALFGQNEPVRNDLLWIGEMKNLKIVKTMLTRYDEINSHLDNNISFVSKTTFADLIYGKTDDDEIKVAMQADAVNFHLNAEFKFDTIDLKQIDRLCRLARETGLTLTILNMIVRTLKDDPEPKENSLFKEVEAKTSSIKALKNSNRNIINQFESEKWIFDIINTVAEMLNFKYLLNSKKFKECNSLYNSYQNVIRPEINQNKMDSEETNQSEDDDNDDDEDEDDYDDDDEDDNDPGEASNINDLKKDQDKSENKEPSEINEPELIPKPNEIETKPLNTLDAIQATTPALTHVKKSKAPKKKPPKNGNTSEQDELSSNIKAPSSDATNLQQQKGGNSHTSEYRKKIFKKISEEAVNAWKKNRETIFENNPNDPKNKPPVDSTSVYKILSIDGGGIRALIPALVLVELEKTNGKRIHEMFDMICGTSTGALVAALVSATPHINLVEFFTNLMANVFQNRTGDNLYSSEKLKQLLKDAFGETKTISECLVNLVIPASSDSKPAKVHIFDSTTKLNKSSEQNITIVDALMATMAAPGFFKPHKIDDLQFLDGGVVVNNPTQIAYDRYKKLVEKKMTTKTSVFILSIGTGKSDMFGAESLFWPGMKDVSLKFTEGQFKALLPNEENYMRLQIELERTICFDEIKSLDSLRKMVEVYLSGSVKSLKKINSNLNEIMRSPMRRNFK